MYYQLFFPTNDEGLDRSCAIHGELRVLHAFDQNDILGKLLLLLLLGCVEFADHMFIVVEPYRSCLIVHLQLLL